ncbi:CADD family putative folate metabolism protein [Candidatus Peregrinibacteria bacterium]|nr:MAG: CADD family putative folate metabolism protein [Candidatus Peregrinibacteria bacterium]
MDFQAKLLTHIDEKHLLKHAFYQMWTEGTLPIEVMQKYAEQYYHLERNFPNFLSAMLMTCDSEVARVAILDNFNDETAGAKNHRELWLRFGEGIGATRQAMKNSTPLPETLAAIETFTRLCSKNYLIGAAALAAYESQIPAIAAKKLEGLIANYGITDERTHEFFAVHGSIDIKHANVWWDMLKDADLSEEEKTEAEASTKEASEALWNFLTGVLKAHMPEALTMKC